MSALAAESAMDRALWCQAVNMQFGELKAVKDVSFDVPPATIQGVLGPNGAGKTTLMNLITGHVKGASGEIGLGHRSMRGMPPHTRARLGLARTFQIPHILQHSTVADNLRLGRNLAAVRERTTKRPADQTARAWTRAAERVLELMSGQLPVHRILATPADELSTASWRLLEVLRALMTHPRVLLMDEPFAGLTVDGIRMLTDAMQHVRDETGMSIVLVEHNLSAVFTCVDRLIVMDNGAVVVAGAAGDPRIVAATHALFRNKADPAAAPRPSPVAPSSSITPAVFAAPQAARARGSRLTAGTPEPARSGAPPSLRVIDLCAGYGQLRVVHGVSLSVEASRPVGIIGLNGAGKTTLLRAIAGITRRLNGEVVVDGRQVAANDPAEAIAAGVSSVLERRHLFPSLTVRENLTVAAANGGRRGGDIDSAIEATLEVVPGVGVWLGRRAGSLSGGQQQLVALARALVTRPKVLLLDEPTTGLSPAAVDDVTRALLDVVASGVAVVVAEQNLRFCEQICRYLYAFAGGNTVAEGRAEDVGRLWDAATR